MYLLYLSIEHRVIIGISAMVLLFASFLIVFISSQRRKLRYHKDLYTLHEKQQQLLTQQNEHLEKKVASRTKELLQQKEELQKSLAELKETQLQLVQREKMASLGELTAGIAHEIQNPLNFVKNFAELSKELAEELESEATQKNWEEVLQLSRSLQQYLSKVTHHGTRAESIVRGMLLHSRITSETKELTNINDLAQEYLQLTYLSIRAKNKSFTATLKTQFDDGLDKINVYPQDISRVLINLYNNAFYSMQEKKKQQGDSYAPVMTVCTKKLEDKIIIHVKDNGMGIPQQILGKIYQPFFTTKPSGEGTGLGLSLSYDIITRGHGGEMMVETKEGEGAAFEVQLPA